MMLFSFIWYFFFSLCATAGQLPPEVGLCRHASVINNSSLDCSFKGFFFIIPFILLNMITPNAKCIHSFTDRMHLTNRKIVHFWCSANENHALPNIWLCRPMVLCLLFCTTADKAFKSLELLCLVDSVNIGFSIARCQFVLCIPVHEIQTLHVHGIPTVLHQTKMEHNKQNIQVSSKTKIWHDFDAKYSYFDFGQPLLKANSH